MARSEEPHAPLASGVPTLETAPEVIPAPQRLAVGQLIEGRYEIRDCIGQGGMGVVYRAFDREIGEEIALKAILSERLSDARALEQIRQEVKIARKIAHPNVCRVFDLGESDGMRFLTMELVEGRSLRSILRAGALGPAEASSIVQQIVDGVAAAHRERVIHRDIKPENVIVRHDGRAIVLDFGLARSMRDESGMLATFAGTPAYMSPEQLSFDAIDARSDVFALGIVAQEVFTGRSPFCRTSAESVARAILRDEPTPFALPSLPKDVEKTLADVIGRALAKAPEDRYPSAVELSEALNRAREGHSVSDEEVVGKTNKNYVIFGDFRRVVSIAATVGVLALVIALVFGASRARSSSGSSPLANRTPLASAFAAPGAPNATAEDPALVLLLPFENRAGGALGDGVALRARAAVRASVSAIPSLSVREVETSGVESARVGALWVVRGQVESIGEDLAISARFEPLGRDEGSELVDVGGAPRDVDALLEELRTRVVDEARLVAKERQWQIQARTGTRSDIARDKLLAYHAMVGPRPRREHFEVGLRMLDEALAADPSYVLSWVERGSLRAYGAGAGTPAERIVAGVADLEQAVRLDGKNPRARVEYCHLLQLAVERSERPTDEAIERAIAACGEALVVDAASADVRIAMARLADRQCRDDDALLLLEESLELDRSFWGRALKHIVTLALLNQRLELAERMSARLVAFQAEEERLGSRAPSRRAGRPQTRGAHFLRGAVLLRLARYDDAAAAFRNEIAAIPEKQTQRWAEAASLQGLRLVARAAGQDLAPTLKRRLDHLEAEYRAKPPSEGARILASAYSFVDPGAAAVWIERMGEPTSCELSVERALIHHAAGDDARARRALSGCKPSSKWESSCVQSLRSQVGD